jgi:hypothetical protein
VFDKSLHSVGIGSGGAWPAAARWRPRSKNTATRRKAAPPRCTDKLHPDGLGHAARLPGRRGHHRARRQIVLDYLNTVPLSAKLGYGEVNGIGDGMWVWYGRDFADVSRPEGPTDTPEAGAGLQGSAVADDRPAPPGLLPGRRREADLEILTNSHLRVLAQAGVITPQLRDAALGVTLKPALGSGVKPPAANAFVSRKAANAVRNHLGNLLGESRLYNLDRLDMSVVSTLDARPSRPSPPRCAA